MIRNTFLHIPQVGPVTEQRLWRSGISSWDDFEGVQASLTFSVAKREHLRQWIEESEARLARGDYRFFARTLPPREHWRAFEEFGNRAGFIDIETDGGNGGDSITLVGLYNGDRMRTFIRGQNLERLPEALSEISLLASFNGSQFDLPILRMRFPRARLDQLHIDLRFALKRLGLCGGLKAIETQLGLKRSLETAGMNGCDAIILWQRYQGGDEEALRLLVAYNREDVEHLLPLTRLAYRDLRRTLMQNF